MLPINKKKGFMVTLCYYKRESQNKNLYIELPSNNSYDNVSIWRREYGGLLARTKNGEELKEVYFIGIFYLLLFIIYYYYLLFIIFLLII